MLILRYPFRLILLMYLDEVSFYQMLPCDFLETDATVFWSQMVLRNEDAETILRQANRQDIVMNRCTKREYATLCLIK